MKYLYDLIQERGLNGDVVKIIMDETQGRREQQRLLYERYKASVDGVPVKSRTYVIHGVEQKAKIIRRLNNDYFSEIIDTKCGYMFGVPIVYDFKEDVLTEKVYQDYKEKIDTFNFENQIADMDAESGKLTAIAGYSGRLLYIGQDGGLHVRNLKGHECVFIYSSEIQQSEFAVRVYDVVTFNAENEKLTLTGVDIYDHSRIYSYLQDENGNYQYKDDYLHLFSGVPLIPVVNNSELLGDAERVIALIDQYDRTLSDYVSELEQFRLAYMKIIGASFTQEDLNRALQTGAFSVPEGADVGFIEKMVNVESTRYALEQLESNINRFSRHVNITDENFAGNQSGVAMKYKMLPLETKCITAERKFTSATMKQFRLLFTLWNTGKAFPENIDLKEMTLQFTRNFPLNLEAEAKIAKEFKGIVSDKTVLSLLSFIDDPEAELERIENESMNSINLDDEVLDNDGLSGKTQKTDDEKNGNNKGDS